MNHRGPSQGRINEEAVSLSFWPTFHARIRQRELERYRDGRTTSHHCATNRTVLAEHSLANASKHQDRNVN